MTAATAETVAPPRTPDLAPRVGLVNGIQQTLTVAWRTLLQVRHDAGREMSEISIQPVIFTLLFTYAFGGAISGDRHTYLQFMIPGMLVMTMLFVTLNVGQGLNTDIAKGVFDRLRSLPIARWAPLAGRIVADQFKQIWSIVLVLAVGMILGFRPESWLGVLGASALLLIFAACFSWVAVLIGVTAKQAEQVQIFAFAVVLPISFVSGVFAPTETMPGWLQAFADVNPVGNLLEATRGLINGGPVAGPVTWLLLWSAGLVAVFAPLSLSALKRRV